MDKKCPKILLPARYNVFFPSLLILVIIHRVGFLILIISSITTLILPTIFTDQVDQEFAANAYKGFIVFCKTGLIILFSTGLLRLYYEFSPQVIPKIVLAVIVAILFFFVNPSYLSDSYMKINWIRTGLIFIIAGVGVLI